MAFFQVENISVRGIAAAVPRFEISNMDYDHLNEQERKLLIKTTGIEKRRAVKDTGVTTADLCQASAEKLLTQLSVNREDIQIVVFVSQTPDYFLPASSIILQNKLGLPKTCIAFDIDLGCSGYVYGLSVVSTLMNQAKLKKGLLLVGDISTDGTPIEDKSVYPLFGDGGTATLLEYDESAEKMTFSLQSDGSGYEAIIVREGAKRKPYTKESFDLVDIGNGIKRAPRNLELNGLDVFNFSVTEVPKNISDFFQKTGTTAESYDYFVMHQANLIMNETIRKKLKFPPEKIPYSLSKFGNTSSASIPLTIVSELRNIVNSPASLLLSGFGVGLSWGTVSLKTKGLVCPELIEM
jgi:3-oxoacyl-[acyl-carrier-protein] synthase-3